MLITWLHTVSNRVKNFLRHCFPISSIATRSSASIFLRYTLLGKLTSTPRSGGTKISLHTVETNFIRRALI